MINCAYFRIMMKVKNIHLEKSWKTDVSLKKSILKYIYFRYKWIWILYMVNWT